MLLSDRMSEVDTKNNNDKEIEELEGSEEEGRVYEIGFHLVPSLSEEEVAQEVGKLKDLIEDAGGEFIAEGYPKMRALEYTIEAPFAVPKERYNHAHFGWIKFEASPETPSAIKEALSRDENIIRMIIIKTVRENTLYGYKLKQKKEAEERREEESEEKTTVEGEKEREKVSDEEIDKSIDEIIV